MKLFNFFKKKNNISKKCNISNFNLNKSKKQLTSLEYFEDKMKECNFKYEKNFLNEYLLFEKNVCPNCACVLDKKVTTTKKCPECGEKIITRTNAYTKKRLLLSENKVNLFEKYNSEMKEILFYENQLKKTYFFHQDYLNIFFNMKRKNPTYSARDYTYTFYNIVASEIDRKNYYQYIKNKRLNKKDRVLEQFEVIRQFNIATQVYVQMFIIQEYKEKIEFALEMLAKIAYRDIQIKKLDFLENPYCKESKEEYVSCVHTSLIMNFLNKYNLTITDFKEIYFNYNQRFIIENLTKENVWNYIEKALKEYR